jgi:curli biogenesis system outer membrane secretion channel CsgG
MLASSTCAARLLAYAVAWLLAALPTAAGAARPKLGVAPLGFDSPNTRTGLAEVITRELGAGGHFDLASVAAVAEALQAAGVRPGRDAYRALDGGKLAQLQGVADYLLIGDLVAFTVAKKDTAISLGHKLSGLAEKTGLGGEVAQVVIDFRLLRVSDGVEVLAFSCEGLESRRGIKLGTVTLGWLGSVNFAGDEFRRTDLGRAFYKALGQALYELYSEFPLTGSVLAVSEDSIVIDLDQRTGVQAGDELTIYRASGTQSTAGQEVWSELERVGSAKVLDFQPGRGLCLMLDGAGRIQEGDIVRPLVERLVLPLEADRQPQQ